MIQMIFATARTKKADGTVEYAFGLNDGLPWGHIKEDLANFKKRTKDHMLIMGANTFASLPAKLKGRWHIVVADRQSRPLPKTKKNELPDYLISEIELTGLVSGDYACIYGVLNGDIFPNSTMRNFSIIGGKKLIEEYIDKVDIVIHTEITKRHRVNSTVQMPKSVLDKCFKFKALQRNWTYVDEVTSILENYYQVP